ncbi:MAG: hypothetical protein LBL04_03445 [Bacteroidales bacterium]|jgi:hypothetical protein|nr:hypothetical protein [Bacteroidales bacterium]
MTVRYSTDFPDIASFYALYESTGWNDKNKKPKEQLFGAMKNSWYFVSVYADDRLIGFEKRPDDAPGMQYKISKTCMAL